MDSRKIVKIGNSYYINIPSDVAQALEIMNGDRMNVSFIPGYGTFNTLVRGADKIPVNPESVDRLQRAADAIRWQLERKAKDLGDNFISNLMNRLIPTIATSGIFDLKRKVDELEKQVEESNKTKGRLTLVRKSKRRTQ